MKIWKSTPTSAPCAATTGARVRISKEIVDFYSGKDEDAQPAKKAIASPGVNAAGAEILKQRGVLSQEEITSSAHKGKKADCHSDNVEDDAEAQARPDQHAEGPRRGGERDGAVDLPPVGVEDDCNSHRHRDMLLKADARVGPPYNKRVLSCFLDKRFASFPSCLLRLRACMFLVVVQPAPWRTPPVFSSIFAAGITSGMSHLLKLVLIASLIALRVGSPRGGRRSCNASGLARRVCWASRREFAPRNYSLSRRADPSNA